MELQRNTHHVFWLMYHFVWIPKYRHKVFSKPYRSELKAIIQKIGYDYNIDIVELGSLGLHLSESLNLTIADIDRHLIRVHIRRGKGIVNLVPSLIMPTEMIHFVLLYLNCCIMAQRWTKNLSIEGEMEPVGESDEANTLLLKALAEPLIFY